MSRNLANPPRLPGPRPGRAAAVAVVAFGANLGDREATIRAAADRIARLPLVSDVRLSPLFETVALRVDGPDPEAPAYVNAVALVTTRLAPSILLGMLHAVEDEHGRERHERWGDRTLDLDLIAYGDESSDDDRLQLPHPRAAERLFVLEPWLALDPDAELPGRGRVADLVTSLRTAEQR
ncbi:2-amino-4-hydroxy-6-hydroxymethyldihydropteridine diphosphokinase [Microbacterium foliorum]|uniref:2-amino-4-hydroxy-6-hydroxymethyldihydropteridine diphosphokinase n=1 Tax=Microbacterium foliorum TaxID=104336 RepID=A0A0F0KJ17_9MICO|nr:2-amino-4-hydroxy-6-hydroxymethyldihydropteridine diphosphokinase [Microbacterium foliorum]AXL11218.1 2-amino-4-hydroxy-6-hydroxymethyldihydropteridine diphosphokinase [Microbacterium foliorum]KJL19241.1 2-amino-4-hydroxy-6-hydroxymethyldihydropteridine pyrophosphokinase [Microbacterium foliorum]CAH0190101.1 2-amino-4-hydroxy-6-hydroxymethyldihydropteridinepyrophosphokinase [Microbacterium foliorum]CAH0226466.1 2-amino-4-hydroxy-6-hydroxymethyldihydropteridinepyrophosphokinase [Microbacteriu